MNNVQEILNSMRKHNRRTILLPVEIDVDGQVLDCMAYDVSLGGVRLKIDIPIDENKSVHIRMKENINQRANVVWTTEEYIGLNFIEKPEIIKDELGVLASTLH